MSLGDEIIFFLSNNPGNYRDLRSRMLGDPFLEEKLNARATERKKIANQERVLRVTLSRLKKRGLVENSQEGWWRLTISGLKKFKDFERRGHSSPNQVTDPKRKMIIAFDIPKDKKESRYWLRAELLGLGFKMMQKSVWLGPAPLPKEALEHLKTLDLLPHLKFFEVKEADLV